MNIGMILEAPFPPDIRVENEAKALAKAGHVVYIFSIRYNGKTKWEKFDENIFVYRLRISQWFFNKIRVSILRFPFYNLLWLTFLRGTAANLSLDAIHVHDLPLAYVGLQLSRQWKIPLILDFHENYPAALRAWEYTRKRLARPFLDYNRWKRYEQEMVTQADRVILVVDEAKERFVRSGFPEKKFVIVSNTLNVINFPAADQKKAKRIRGSDFIILYIGGFGVHRGLETAIKAMPKILDILPKARLLLVGEGYNRDKLKHIVGVRNIVERVEFTGWIPFQEIPTYIAASDICLIPYLRTEHTETTVPHKLFQAWYLSKPVVVSDCRPLRRIVQEIGGGLVFKAGNPKDLAQKVICLKDPQLRQEMGGKGKQAVLNRYNWSVDGQRLVQLYRELLHGD